MSAGEFRQFLGIARGSNCELETQLEIARALSFGNSALINEAESLSIEVRKMLFGLLESLSPGESRELAPTKNSSQIVVRSSLLGPANEAD